MSLGSTEQNVLAHFAQRLELSGREIAEHFDMPRSTVAAVLGKLEETEAICRNGTAESSGGRPAITYQIRLARPVAVCQFDGTQLAGAIFDERLRSGAPRLEPLAPIKNIRQAAQYTDALLTSLLVSAGVARERLGGVVLTINAVLSGDRVLVSSVLPWATDVLESEFASELRLPVRVFSLPGLYAEYQKLDQPLPRSLVHFRVGDGVSAHMMWRGDRVEGHSGLGGELGHVTVVPDGTLCGCGRRGCLEAYCSGPAIARRVLMELGSGVMSRLNRGALTGASPRDVVAQLWRAWQGGDDYAHACMDDVLGRLGWGLGLTVNLLDPALVAFGGYLFSGKPEWVEETRRHAARWTLNAASRGTRYELSTVTVEDELRIAAAMASPKR